MGAPLLRFHITAREAPNRPLRATWQTTGRSPDTTLVARLRGHAGGTVRLAPPCTDSAARRPSTSLRRLDVRVQSGPPPRLHLETGRRS